MNYGSESFESVIKKLKSYVAQNNLDKKPSVSATPFFSSHPHKTHLSHL
jgi:hypothetical protein